MADGLRLALALGVSGCVTAVAAPIAWRVAWRTNFLDVPVRYKQHARATPYLGGAAVVIGFLVAATAVAKGWSTAPALLVCMLVLFVVGTADDRLLLGVGSRLTFQIGTAAALWLTGEGWDLFSADAANLALTVLWVVGVVNAFNLFDNLDGATGSVAGACAVGICAVALTNDAWLLGALAAALAGSCAGFLPYNLSNPARIFLGDGGSMPIGLLVAGLIMALPVRETGVVGLLALAPLAGLPILDTTLVVFSRWRRGVPVLHGARDHLTHRLLRRLGSARVVALALATSQLALSSVGLALDHSRAPMVVGIAAAYLGLGAAAIVLFESRPWRPQAPVPEMSGDRITS